MPGTGRWPGPSGWHLKRKDRVFYSPVLFFLSRPDSKGIGVSGDTAGAFLFNGLAYTGNQKEFSRKVVADFPCFARDCAWINDNSHPAAKA